MKYNFCTCVNDYNDDCDCLNVVATMLVRREVHKVVAYFRNANPTKVPVSMFRHYQSLFCLCDNFSPYIQVSWDEIVGESMTYSIPYNTFYNSPGAMKT